MLRKVIVSMAVLTALSISLCSAGVPKLLVLEHFADYFG